MKVLSILLTTVLAATAVHAAAEPVPDAEATWRFCQRPGQGCHKLKRAAEAAAEALAAAEPEPFCTRVGQGCKRDAKAEADWRFCQRPGQGCHKAKRAADALANAVADAMAAAEPQPEADAEAVAAADALCNSEGQPCWKVKRAAEAIAEALAEPEAGPDAEPWCTRPGQGCKRDADPKYKSSWRFCQRPGQGCFKAKRGADALADAAANAVADL